MACPWPEPEESILFLIEILSRKFLTGFDNTPKVAYQFQSKKLSITIRANSKLQSLGAG
jgi:hypothetical protein